MPISQTQRQAIRKRRVFWCCMVAMAVVSFTLWSQSSADSITPTHDEYTLQNKIADGSYTLAVEALGELAVRERASRDGYARTQFSPGWGRVAGCDMRNRILQRDLVDIVLDDDRCTVLSGTLKKDMFSGQRIEFDRGPETSDAIHIEHIVAVSDAWQKGAQDLDYDERNRFYNDPLNLIAIDGPTNREKGDKDASDWLPRLAYRCRYVARQIAIKKRYELWLDPSEHRAMKQTLQACPLQVLPVQPAQKDRTDE